MSETTDSNYPFSKLLGRPTYTRIPGESYLYPIGLGRITYLREFEETYLFAAHRLSRAGPPNGFPGQVEHFDARLRALSRHIALLRDVGSSILAVPPKFGFPGAAGIFDVS